MPIHCNDFESQIDGWTFAGGKSGGGGDFEWGAPEGMGGDPAAAFSGQKVIGQKLGGDGKYLSGKTASATSPVIDVGGEKHVRLQYRRWLNVQDGFRDRAIVSVNGQTVWQNAATDASDGLLDHRDAEWRFEDIDLSSIVQNTSTVEVRFELAANNGGQLGGWTIDDFCIVAWRPTPPAPPPDAGTTDGGAIEPGEPAAGCGCAVPGRSEAPSFAAIAVLGALTGAAALRRRRGSGARPSTG
ncbi:MAG: hypothetical protein QM820_26135 [Minicystis sp.]